MECRFPELCLETEDNKVKPSLLKDSTWNEIQSFENNLLKQAMKKTQSFGPLNLLNLQYELPSFATIPAICESKALKDLSNFDSSGGSLCINSGLKKRARLEFNSLEFMEPIGSGYFKTVYRGIWRGFDVAIARLKKGGPLQEARLLQSIPPHPNIIKFHKYKPSLSWISVFVLLAGQLIMKVLSMQLWSSCPWVN